MATKTVNVKSRQVVKTEEYIDGYTLELSAEEFEAIMALVGSVVGRGPLKDATHKIWADVFEKVYIESGFGRSLDYYPIFCKNLFCEVRSVN